MSRWWEGALRRWSEALALNAKVVTVQEGETLPRTGNWACVDGLWRFRLDDHHYVVFGDAAQSEALRQALGWTLQLAKRTTQRSWREQMHQAFSEYLAAHTNEWTGHTQQSTAKVSLAERGDMPGYVDHALLASVPPGYFVWIHPVQPKSGVTTADADALAEEVIRAATPGAWLGWIAPRSSVPYYTALLYYTVDSLDEANEDSDIHNSEGTSHAYQELLRLRSAVESLLSQLESDAFYSARAAVSRKVEAAARGIESGIQSAVSTWHARQPNGPDKVVLWADTPVEHMLLHMTRSGMQSFEEIVSMRSPNRSIDLTPELVETLEGVTAANLNVSEAARLLYLHRNTLLHRIDRIRQQTGYDVRNFKDAMVLWLLKNTQDHGGNR